jgi:comEA protein
MTCHLAALRAGRVCLVLLALCSAQVGLAKKKPPAHPVNLNTASSGELQLVPGIGPSTADKILAMRKSYGAFKGVDDLLAIKGIGPKRLDKMRRYLTVGKAAQGSKVEGAVQSKAPAAKTPATKSTAMKKPPVEPQTSEDEEP